LLAIKNARIHPVDRPVIENGSILIDNGKIAYVGASIEIPDGAEVIDAGVERSTPVSPTPIATSG
jgi:imidazolonepropionase-like amidohydrolase